MILMIDNYDSFTYNLVQYFRELTAEIRVVRNDAIDIDGIREAAPAGIVVSPGPGRPEDAGVSCEAIRAFAGKVPILGVCLGHQAIALSFGGTIIHAKRLMHGKVSDVTCNGEGIFKGLGDRPFKAMRYHSLAVDQATLPDCLEVTATFLPFEMGTALDVNSICKVRPFAPLKARPADFPLGPFTNLKDGSVLTVVGREAWVSSDEGKTWAKYPMFRDPKFKTIPEHSAVCLASGTVVVNFINVGEQHYSWNIQTKRPNPDNRLPTYSVRSLDNGRTWEDPVLLADDYSGCMRSVIQLKDGTLVSMVQRLNYPEGRNYSQPYWSDDEGKTWHGADVMDCGGEHGDHSGLIEAALVELKDGRVWTLLRSYHGCFYEAFSSDSGRTWNPIPPRKSKIASTGSPGTIERMSDGSLLLVYNAIPTKGYERREELFASFSDDDGETWTKPVVIARCPGARVAYPYILERRPGELWISAMQGNLRTTVGLAELRAVCSKEGVQ